jgi:Na+-driven multidrug efflux pump
MTDLQKKAAFEDYPVPKALSAFILPTVLSNLIGILYNLADTFFVGHTGDTSQIAALGIVTPVFLVMAVVSAVFSVGANAGISAALGAGNRARARQVASFSIYAALAAGCVFTVVLAFVLRPFLYLIGAGETTIDHCVSYLVWTVFGGFHSLHCLPSAFPVLSGGGRDKNSRHREPPWAGYSTSSSIPIFIFALNMGITGAAIATCISNYAALLFLSAVYAKKRGELVFSLNPKYCSGGDGVAASVLLIGIPSGFALCLTIICDFIRFHFIGLLGTETDLAAFAWFRRSAT